MKAENFQKMDKELREEWRRQETTSAAVAMLREAENTAAMGVLREAESMSDANSVAMKAGVRLGLAKAIQLLTED